LTFRGTFEHSLDAKHRLTVPAKFRRALEDGVVLAVLPETTPGTPPSISMWPPAAFDQFAEASLAALNPLSARARDLKRVLNNNSHDVDLDSANRIMIPASLIRYAGLDKDVVVTGSGECLELWDRAAYTAYNESALARFSDLVASVGDTD
jgi:MraZ protein